MVRTYISEFPLWLRWLRTQLVSMKMQVQSLASLCGLRIQRCHELWCGLWMRLRSGIIVARAQAGLCSSDSTPSLETSTCHRCGLKKERKKKKKKNIYFTGSHLCWLRKDLNPTPPQPSVSRSHPHRRTVIPTVCGDAAPSSLDSRRLPLLCYF